MADKAGDKKFIDIPIEMKTPKTYYLLVCFSK